MLVKFIDDMFMRGSIPYDKIYSIREGHNGWGIIKCEDKSIINTSMDYSELLGVYEKVIDDEIELMFGEEEEGDE